MTNSLTTSTLGATTDDWGHTWTLAQLNTANFRVRIIDVSSMNGKDSTSTPFGSRATTPRRLGA